MLVLSERKVRFFLALDFGMSGWWGACSMFFQRVVPCVQHAYVRLFGAFDSYFAAPPPPLFTLQVPQGALRLPPIMATVQVQTRMMLKWWRVQLLHNLVGGE